MKKMSDKRMLARVVSQSRKINSLSLKAAILWTWSIPWFDSHGYIEVDLDFLKFNVVPRRIDIPQEEIPSLLAEIEMIRLWKFYVTPDGKKIAFDPMFFEFQTLREDRLGRPRFDPGSLQDHSWISPGSGVFVTQQNHLTPGSLLDQSRITPDLLPRREEKRREGKTGSVRDHSGSKLERESQNTPPKDPFGEFKNVFLTKEEYQKLCAKFEKGGVDRKIEYLSGQITSLPKQYGKYKSHYATLRNWLDGDGLHVPPKKEPLNIWADTKPEPNP